MINPRFITYFEEKFFPNAPEEFQDFLDSLEKPIARSLRIRPDKDIQVRKRLSHDGWILQDTPLPYIYHIHRGEDFNPFDRRIGMSMDHLVGNFYIQELAAAHPVVLLADHKIHQESYLILDMASSPWWKTTQLTEYFPKSFIIANEPTRERIPQLLQNLERMGTPNVGITLYPGQWWRRLSEVFDRILLDAPCSGEGTLYKGTDALKNWHIKSIKQIATLQKKLIESALVALKVWGEMVYSTCSLNDLENEHILQHIQEKFWDHIEIFYEKKFWPHIDATGGFFVARIRKIGSLPPSRTESNHHTNSNSAIRRYPRDIAWWTVKEGMTLYEHEDKILAVKNNHCIENIRDAIYLMRFGEHIGTLHRGEFIHWARAFRYILPDVYNIYTISSEEELDRYLRWALLPYEDDDGYVLITYQEELLSLEYATQWFLSNRFPKDWLRR